jgi:hypothetical protein
LRVKLRNTTDDPLIVTGAELVLDDTKVTDSTEHASTEVSPVAYNWIVTVSDIERRSTTMSLSRRLDKKEPGVLDFVMGFEKRHAGFAARGRLRLHYNAGKVVESAPFDLHIVNGPGEFPRFNFPDSSAELTSALRAMETPFALRQMIEELAKRRFAPASPEIQRYLSNPDATVRTAAAEYFAEIPDPEATASLARLVEAHEPQAKRAAIKALVAQGDAAFADIEQLMGSKDAATREAAVTMLGNFPTDRSRALLSQAIDDRAVTKVVAGDEVLVCEAALRALARVQATSEADRIIDKLDDANRGVQSAAIDAVAELHLRLAAPILRRMALTGEPRIREQASAAVKSLQ